MQKAGIRELEDWGIGKKMEKAKKNPPST